MTIELTVEQLRLIRELVEQRVAELGPEIRHTRTAPYRSDLKHQREVLRTAGARLEDRGAEPVEV